MVLNQMYRLHLQPVAERYKKEMVKIKTGCYSKVSCKIYAVKKEMLHAIKIRKSVKPRTAIKQHGSYST